jgi:hypothetical protein
MLFSLPDNDHYSHHHGPEASEVSITHADGCLAELVAPAGGLDAFLETNAVIVMADHAQSDVDAEVDLAAVLEGEWHVLRPNEDEPERAELAVGPSSRAAGIWILRDGARGRKLHEGSRAALAAADGIDLLCWLEQDGEPVIRDAVGPPPAAAWAVIERGGRQLRFAPGTGKRARFDRRGCGWQLDGSLDVLDGAEPSAGAELDFGPYPDAFSRLWAALHSPYAGDILVSAVPGYEFLDWGGASHVRGGSHGSLHRIDSQQPLLTVGLDCPRPERAQWAISDVADLVLAHFGLDPQPPAEPLEQVAA